MHQAFRYTKINQFGISWTYIYEHIIKPYPTQINTINFDEISRIQNPLFGFHLKTRIEQLYNPKEVTEQINHWIDPNQLLVIIQKIPTKRER